MTRWNWISRVIALSLVLTPGDSTGLGDSLDRELRRSLQRRERSTLVELGRRTSPLDLAPFLLSDGDRGLVMAAALAAPHSRDPWLLLSPLAVVANSPDRPIAAAAALAAVKIADVLDVSTAFERDIAIDAISDALDAWREISASHHRWADVRVHALVITKQLAIVERALSASSSIGENTASHFLPERWGDLQAMGNDIEPEVRRAAFELLAQPPRGEAIAIAAQAVADDRDPVVALAAAQAICSGLAPGESAQSVLAALGEVGLSRLRQLIQDGQILQSSNPDRVHTEGSSRPADNSIGRTSALSLAAMLDSTRCLVADASPESMRALRVLRSNLRSTGPKYAYKRIRRLMSGPIEAGKP
ncbi:MAG: hypothetical protein MJE77_09495 [Proteobacteria bacterium]|nr:hypothetical protein [Pseudomonadota bacterium]